jgi:hypothetical protein
MKACFLGLGTTQRPFPIGYCLYILTVTLAVVAFTCETVELLPFLFPHLVELGEDKLMICTLPAASK